MSLLFQTDSNNNVILHSEVVKLIPMFAALDEKEMLYIVLFADYNSPYKQFPENDRRRRAMFHVYNDNVIDKLESDTILMAIDYYISLQYSPKIETAKVYQKKIDTYQEQLLKEDDAVKCKKLADAIDDFTKRIAALNKDYDKEMQKIGVVKGKMELSWLEIVKSNQKLFESITSKGKK